MKVCFVPSEEHKDALTLQLDDDYWCDVHTWIFGKRPSFPALFSDKDEFLTTFEETEKSLALKYALKRLSMRGYTAYEIEKMLKEKLVSEHNCKAVVAACAEYGYLHDEKWLAGYVKGQISRKQGPATIRQKLQLKGFSDETISDAIEELGTDAQKEAIQKILTTRYRSKNLEDAKERNKIIGSLLRKGYSLDLVREALGQSEFDR